MIRAFWFFLLAGFIAALAAWLADNPGRVVMQWFDFEIETSVALLIVFACAFALLAIALLRTFDIARGGPAALMSYREERRKSKGVLELTRGFAAAAIGDAGAARRHLEKATGSSDLTGLQRLLSARVSELEDDFSAAEESYRQLLKDQDTEFLGLRGLYETALRQGDRAAALEFATRAFQLNPKSEWVAKSLFRVQTQSGAFDLARQTIVSAKRGGALTAEAARRQEAVLSAAEALSAETAGDREKAAIAAQKALMHAPDLVPMAVILAKSQAMKGQAWSAAATIESAWRVNPHPDLAEAYRKLKPDETAAQRARRLIGLAEFNPADVESALLAAGEYLSLGEPKRALKALRPHLEFPTARVAMLMSAIEAARNMPREAEAWRERALLAPRDAHWSCRECGRERRDWRPVCDSCGSFDSYAWAEAGMFGGARLVEVPKEALPRDEDLLDDIALLTPSAPMPQGAAGAMSAADPSPALPLRSEPEIFVPLRPPDDPGTDDRPARDRGDAYF